MQLLDSQRAEVLAVIDASPFQIHDVIFDRGSDSPILRLRADPDRVVFVMGGMNHCNVHMTPGISRLTEDHQVANWSFVLKYVGIWLNNVKREQDAAERGFAPADPPPDWLPDALPSDYVTTVKQAEALQEKARRMHRMGSLLWDTGETLNRVVRDAFRDMGFDAELTKAGETFDLMVPLAIGRLLIEVTGIDGQVTKASKKISQVLAVQQQLWQSGDRVCLAVNAYRKRPLLEREPLELVTPEALRLLIGMDAVVVTTSDLFKLWVGARDHSDAARKRVDKLRTGPSGIVRLT